MEVKNSTKIKFVFLFFIGLCFVMSIIMLDGMKQQGIGYYGTTEITEFYFCDGPGEDGTPLHAVETISIQKIKEIYLCGFLITNGWQRSLTIDVFQEPISRSIYTFPSTTKVMPGYFYLPMGDIIENTGEFRVEVMNSHKIIATARIQINE